MTVHRYRLQEALAAAAAAQYQGGGEEDVYPAGAHAIGHGGVHGEGGEGGQVKRTSDWVQEGEEEQDEAKKARIDGDPGIQSAVAVEHSIVCLVDSVVAVCMYSQP